MAGHEPLELVTQVRPLLPEPVSRVEQLRMAAEGYYRMTTRESMFFFTGMASGGLVISLAMGYTFGIVAGLFSVVMGVIILREDGRRRSKGRAS